MISAMTCFSGISVEMPSGNMNGPGCAKYLLPPYQHMGLGRRIFAQVRQAARERKLDSFFCGCNVHNLPARRFYEKMGGVVGEIDDGHENLAEDQMYFEFCTGEQI